MNVCVGNRFNWEKDSSVTNSICYFSPGSCRKEPDSMTLKRILILAGVAGAANLGSLALAQSTLPTIQAQPQEQTATIGDSALFSVKADSVTPLTYQWRWNGFEILNATNQSYAVPSALPPGDPQQNGPDLYDVIVVNSSGAVTSKVAALVVVVPPEVVQQPADVNAPPFQSATFNIIPAGTTPLTFHWRHNGQFLNDNYAYSSNYFLPQLQWSDAGDYDVVVANQYGSVTSHVGVLTVQDPTQPFINAPSNVVAKCSGPEGTKVSFNVTASDQYDQAPKIVCEPPSGSNFPIGTSQVKCTAWDYRGNTNVTYFTVQVVGTCDQGCIAIDCPPDMHVQLGSQSTAKVDFTVTAKNTCTGQPYPVYCKPPSGSEFPLGTNTVTCVASVGGASEQCQFNVIVEGAAPPVLQLPPQITTIQVTNGQGQAGSRVFFHVNAISAANLKTSLEISPPPGSFFPPGTNHVTVFAEDVLGNKVIGNVDIAVVPPPELNLENWGFEIGFLGWAPSGSAFEFPPVVGDLVTAKRIPALRQQLQNAIGGDYWRDLYYPVGEKGTHWICTANVTDWSPAGNLLDDMFDDSLTGSLISKSFVIDTRAISFLIGGMKDIDHLRVELLVQAPSGSAGDVTLLGTAYNIADFRTGDGNELMRRDWWDTESLIGQNARIRILDTSTAGHLNVDDFRFQDVTPLAETVQIGGTTYPATVFRNGVYYDWDSPVWGFADMHTHPMANLGFGQKLFHGAADGGALDPTNPAVALDDCNCDHGGWGFDNTCGDYFRELIMSFTDDGGPDPHREGWSSNELKQFRKWPVFSSLSHQQMWYEWMKRTYEGGERVLVALCVNNRLLAAASKGVAGAPHDDLAVGDLQISELKAFVDRHSDFMEIAYDPFQLRDIIRRNKLAIIIGSELDDIGNFCRDSRIIPNLVGGQLDVYSRDQVRAEIQRLYDEGVRYMFTVHLSDNKFGGTPLASDMLNIGSKFLNNGQALIAQNAAAEDDIHFWLSDMDFTHYVSTEDQVGIATAVIAGGPLLPVIEPAIESIIPNLAPLPPGGGGAMVAPILPIVTVGALGAAVAPDDMLRVILGAVGLPGHEINDLVNAHILPLPGNYPAYPSESAAPYGVRNAKGLTPLGEFAVKEMMKHGMILDVDHMSQNTLSNVIEIATNVPGGYPLNSGHNSFRETNFEPTENHRSPEQLETIRQLGGMMGVGWENAKDGSFTRSFASLIPSPEYSSSSIANDCAGTSKSWAQLYLYALEKLHGQNVAFGTDASGVIQFPGPRFGPQSAYGLDEAHHSLRPAQIELQGRSHPDGVLYTPLHGHPLTTSAFVGRGMDPDDELAPPTRADGYEYNKAQVTFFAAIPIFYWVIDNSSGLSQGQVNSMLESFEDALSPNYPNRRHTKEYAFGLVDGYKGWDTQSDFFDGDVGTCQQLGKSIYLSQVLGQPPLSDVTGNATKLARYRDLLIVWNHFHRAFGPNTPLTRCQTGYKQWDINFEGVAHYGLIPDFLQDLHNVGMEPQDMSVLFRSAEEFARMWTKSVDASYWFQPHFFGPIESLGDGISINFTHGDEKVSVEETANLSSPKWQSANSNQSVTNGIITTIQVPVTNHTRFYRLRTE